MILAEKISKLRKKNGWSQEELAEKMEVSRQAVSKWESAQSIPDLDKILILGNLFGVTTDYLLKDEMENEEFADEQDKMVRRISLKEANEFLDWRKLASVRIAAGTFLCVIAAIPLLLLAAATECGVIQISENLAGGIGLITLLVLVTIAVGIFLNCGFKNTAFEFIDKEPFETEYGVKGMVKEKQNAYRNMYAKYNITATCICVLSAVPLLIGSFTEKEFFTVFMLTITMLCAGIGVAIFIVAGVQWASMQKLLQEGEFTISEKRKGKMREAVSSIYWLTVTAIYLGWSFWTNAWETTWIVWPVAGVVFAVVMCVCNILSDRES